MLFTARQRALVESGQLTLTFRAWKSPQVTPGGTYRFSEGHDIAVDIVERVAAGDITDVEAQRAGEATARTLISAIARASRVTVDETTLLYRVAFRLVPSQPRAAPAAPVGDVVQRLQRMDRLSSHGRWTLVTLIAIGERPRVAASHLASSLGRERLAFKADVRKLKAMGLTRSFEVGYELTAPGEAAIEALQTASRDG